MHVFSKEFHILVVKPRGESGFPRFLRECVKRISLEGIERKRLALGFFCQSLFFFKQKTAYEIRLSLVGSGDVYKRQNLLLWQAAVQDSDTNDLYEHNATARLPYSGW